MNFDFAGLTTDTVDERDRQKKEDKYNKEEKGMWRRNEEEEMPRAPPASLLSPRPTPALHRLPHPHRRRPLSLSLFIYHSISFAVAVSRTRQRGEGRPRP
jgi:hypothetical protein